MGMEKMDQVRSNVKCPINVWYPKKFHSTFNITILSTDNLMSPGVNTVHGVDMYGTPDSTH